MRGVGRIQIPNHSWSSKHVEASVFWFSRHLPCSKPQGLPSLKDALVAEDVVLSIANLELVLQQKETWTGVHEPAALFREVPVQDVRFVMWGVIYWISLFPHALADVCDKLANSVQVHKRVFYRVFCCGVCTWGAVYTLHLSQVSSSVNLFRRSAIYYAACIACIHLCEHHSEKYTEFHTPFHTATLHAAVMEYQ